MIVLFNKDRLSRGIDKSKLPTEWRMAGWGQAWDVLVERQQAESTRGSMASGASEGKVFGTSTSRKLPGQIVELTGGARNI